MSTGRSLTGATATVRIVTEAEIALQTEELSFLIDNLETVLKSAHAAQVAAREALRKLSKQTEFRPGGQNWDWELAGSGLEDILANIRIPTVKETQSCTRLGDQRL